MCCGSVRDWLPSKLCPPDRPAQPAVWRCARPVCVSDTLPVLRRQLPTLAGEILARLRAQDPAGPAPSGVLQAQDALTTAGFRPLSWEELRDNPAPPSFLDLSGLATLRPKGFPRLGLSAAALSAVCRPAPSSPSLLTTFVRALVRDLKWRSLVLTTAASNGLPLWNGAQPAVDTTIVSPLTANGVARSLRGPARPIALQEARRRKEATYPELVGNARCRLVALRAEVGGRWSAEAAEFVRLLAHAKARAAPAVLRPALRVAYVHRWSGLPAAAASLAFADSLTCLPSPGLSNLDGPGPDISDLLAGVRDAPDVSRLPAR